MGAMSATFVGHYPWFVTYNTLQEKVPTPDGTAKKLVRNAAIGFAASLASDTTSNSLRVLKVTTTDFYFCKNFSQTYRQTSAEKIGYLQCAKNIIKSDGIVGLFGRGLKTRILTNGIQGMMFSVLWKYFEGK